MPKNKNGGFFKEFKAFAMRGNVIDLAVGVIIGAAFGKITASLVSDIITPFIGMFLGGVDLKKIEVVLPDWFGSGAVNVLLIGSFISTIIDFFIIALVVFLFVKLINKIRGIKPAAPESPAPAPPAPEPTKTELLLTDIRDLLKDRES